MEETIINKMIEEKTSQKGRIEFFRRKSSAQYLTQSLKQRATQGFKSSQRGKINKCVHIKHPVSKYLRAIHFQD
jgi:hypothetical protein